MKLIKYLVFLTAVVACSSHLVAGPVTVSPATYSVGMIDGTCECAENFSAPGSYSFGGMTASVTVFPDTSLQVTAGQYGSAGAQMIYYFAVQSNQGSTTDGVTIPLIIFYSLSASGQGNGQSATAQISAGGEEAEAYSTQSPGTLGGYLDVSYVTGQEGSITLQVSASGGSEASADPYIEIDPSFAGASNYSIVVSQGVGNVAPSGVPEPGTIALCGGGFLALFYGLRRRKREAL
jgi:hypothetical protein